MRNMNKRLKVQYKRTHKREMRHLTAVKGEAFSQHNEIERAIFTFIHENPQYGEIKKDGKSTMPNGKSWYYALDSSGDLIRPVRIRVSDHACGWRRHKELVNLMLYTLSGELVEKSKLIYILKMKLDKEIRKQKKEV